MPVLDPGCGRTKTGYFWAIARDDRPWGGPEPPGVVYTYAPGRSAALGLKPRAGCAGIVQCDGYAVDTCTRPARAGNQVARRSAAFLCSADRPVEMQFEPVLMGLDRAVGQHAGEGSASELAVPVGVEVWRRTRIMRQL